MRLVQEKAQSNPSNIGFKNNLGIPAAFATLLSPYCELIPVKCLA
jgi:hypothetical protein